MAYVLFPSTPHMNNRCTECKGSTLWDDDLGSSICTTCGTLTDPSQSLLTSHDSTFTSWDSTTPAILKSFRQGTNWDLAGQGKESRIRKNTYDMHLFIRSLANSANASGLSPRVINLFTQAMSVGNYRWGRKAKLVAGACLAIALRESNRPDSLRDIAFILDEAPSSLNHTFTGVSSLLHLDTSPVGPAAHLSTLENHLHSILASADGSAVLLPPGLIAFLANVSLRAAVNTATSLTDLVDRLHPNDSVSHPSSAPSACAAIMLALEAEARTPMENLGQFAKCLGTRCHVGEGTVMTRYKLMQDQVAAWIEMVPWLQSYQSKKGRAKISKRLVVARGLKDVVRLQEDAWQNSVRPLAAENSDLPSESRPCQSGNVPSSVDDRPRKRPKTRATHDAAQFLLDPLAGPLPTQLDQLSSWPQGEQREWTTPLPLASYMLCNPVPLSQTPTRLQLLAAARGGTGPEEIRDDELFEAGELDGLMRNEDEQRAVLGLLDWESDEDEGSVLETTTQSRSRAAQREAAPLVKKKRVNMEALARFMQEDGDEDEIGEDDSGDLDSTDYKNGSDTDGLRDDNANGRNHYPADLPSAPSTPSSSKPHGSMTEDGNHLSDDGGTIVDEWRPLSPETGTRYRPSSDRYFEEYN